MRSHPTPRSTRTPSLLLVATCVATGPLAVPASAQSCRAAEPAAHVTRTAWLMGTRARIDVEGRSRAEAIDASEAVLRVMSRAEERLSTWREDSELTRLNRLPPGITGRPDRDLAALLAEVASWVSRTDGAFDPAVGALVDVWDLRGSGRVPSPDELRAARSASGRSGVHVDPSTGAVTRHAHAAWLDAGGFGKGAALRQARVKLTAHGVRAAVLDLGGQVTAFGPEPLTLSVAHPADRDTPAFRLEVADASVATSGQSERAVAVDGERLGHILDPRDGRPVPAWGSVTVVAPDPLTADVLSTALYVMGPDTGLEWATEREVAALFSVVTDSGLSQRMTPAMESHAVEHARKTGRDTGSTLDQPLTSVPRIPCR